MTERTGFKLREFLPDQFEGMEGVVKDEIRKEQGLSKALFAWEFVGAKASEAIQGTLDLDLFEILARAWCKVRELYKYTDSSKYSPEETFIAHLSEHETPPIPMHPVLQVQFGPILGPRLRFTLEVTAKFHLVALSIRNGHIVGIGSSDGSACAQLKYGAVKLHKALESKPVKLTDELTFKEPGFPISGSIQRDVH